MQPMRDLMRGSLARSLRTLTEEDRLAAALPLVCGSALASHCAVSRLGEDRVLHLRVDGHEWLRSILPMRDTLQHDLQRVAGVSLAGVHFDEAGAPADKRTWIPLRAERADTGAAAPTSARPRPRTRPRSL